MPLYCNNCDSKVDAEVLGSNDEFDPEVRRRLYRDSKLLQNSIARFILSRLNSSFGSSVQTPGSAVVPPTSRPSFRGVIQGPL